MTTEPSKNEFVPIKTLEDLSNEKTNNKSLFRQKPPIDLVNMILKSMGFQYGLLDTKSFTKDDLSDEGCDEWIALLDPYYIPCKARRYLGSLTKDSFVTIIRHIVRVHNFDIRTQEKIVCGVKKTVYRIEPNTPSFSSQPGILMEFN